MARETHQIFMAEQEKSNEARLQAGYRFDLMEHLDREMSRNYLLVQIVHPCPEKPNHSPGMVFFIQRFIFFSWTFAKVQWSDELRGKIRDDFSGLYEQERINPPLITSTEAE